jgi:hypothetical protein
MQKTALYFLISAIVILKIDLLLAAQIRGVYFQDFVTVGGEVLKIRGAGLLKLFFFKIYIPTLYLPSDITSRDVLDDVPKKIEYYFLSDMKAEQFTESGEHILQKNASDDELARIRKRIDAINILYRDVGEGERYLLTYTPGKGTELALNGKVLGRIEG